MECVGIRCSFAGKAAPALSPQPIFFSFYKRFFAWQLCRGLKTLQELRCQDPLRVRSRFSVLVAHRTGTPGNLLILFFVR
jgi:hypothetical protein